MKMAEFVYSFWMSGEWTLILLSNFDFAGKNNYELLVDVADIAIAHVRYEKTMQFLTDRYQFQSSSGLVQSCVASCNTS